MSSQHATKPSRRAIRAIAFVEAAKGVIVLLAATGLASMVHEDLHHLAAQLVAHLHLNPASEYPHIFLDAAAHWQPRLVWLALGAAVYSTLRLVEAYGLFWERAWAEGLAAVGGGVYVPVELVELIRKPSALGLVVLTVNVIVVAVMVRALFQRRQSEASRAR